MPLSLIAILVLSLLLPHHGGFSWAKMKTIQELQDAANSLTLKQMHDAQDAAGSDRTGFPYPLDSPSPLFYIKYGNSYSCLTIMEAETQTFTYHALEVISRSAAPPIGLPRVPKIFRVVGGEYIIMEYVQGTTFLNISETKSREDQLEYIDRIAKAIDILLTIPVPSDAAPGPYRGGLIKHPLFRDSEAPKVFDDVASLQDYVNYMSTMPQRSRNTANPPRPECQLDCQLYLVYADLYPGNFIFDADGALWIIDFEHANLLPLCFQTYALVYPFSLSAGHAKDVHQRMRTKLPTDNIDAMKRARDWFIKCTFGLGIPRGDRFKGTETYHYLGQKETSGGPIPQEVLAGTLNDGSYSCQRGYSYIPLLLAGGALGLGIALRYMGGRCT
ncbi:kinase-like domain [Cordyceps militaris]|uniref:Kinase-like domain n=1 Tax=Cordyceps militaris TaxID=73501 RepID=A0A2H4SEP1_CORMI|nr:kinase-like domain [Cordyceps militaris]